jgi:hypothetical protein
MLSNPRVIFGVHSVTPYNRTSGLPYGTARVVGEASLGLTGDLQKLFGGSSRFPWAIEDGVINTELALKLKEYPNFLFELFLGKAPTDTAADSAGTVSALVNKLGTSIVAATGLASIAVKSAAKADLKFTKYVIKAVDATHIDIYAMSNVDFSRGTDALFQDDLLKITATPLAITTGAAVDIPNFGLTVTGGASATAFVSGDTATFEVKPISSKTTEVTVGGTSDVFPEMGMIIVAQQSGTQEMVELDVFRCKGIGLPLAFAEKKFSEPEIKVEAYYDSVKNGVFSMRHIIPA